MGRNSWWIGLLAFSAVACSVYRSDGRKFLEDNPLTYASGSIHIQAVCTENKEMPWPTRWSDGRVELRQSLSTRDLWFMQWPPNAGGCLVQVLDKDLSDAEVLKGLLELPGPAAGFF